MGETLIRGEEIRKNMLKLLNDELLVGLTGLFEKKHKKFDFRTEDSPAEVERIFSFVVINELFDGRKIENPKQAEEMTEQHLFGKIVVNGELKSLSLKYYVDKKFILYFGSLDISKADTVYA